MINVVNRWNEKAGLRTGCGVRSQVIDVLKAQIKKRPAIKKVSTRAAAQSSDISQLIGNYSAPCFLVDLTFSIP